MRSTSLLFLAAGLLFATPSRAQWATQRAPAGLFDLTDVHFTDADHGYASGSIGGLMKTTDGGQTWISVPTGVSSSLRDVYFVTPDTGYVVGNVGVIIGTTDGGLHWDRHDLGGTGSAINGVHFHDGQHGLVTQGDQIWRTEDGGQNWQSVYTYNGPLNIFTFRFLEFTDATTGYAVGGFSGSSGNVSQVVKTTDGGQTWQLLSAQGMGAAAAVAFPDAQTGYVADVSDRLFRTLDGGQTWTLVTWNTFGSFYGMHFTDALTGYGVGFGGNLRRTTDGGQTWQDQSLNQDDVYSSVYFPTPQIGYAVGSLGTAAAPTVLQYTAPTGLPEPLSAIGVRAYPNPARAVLNLTPLRTTGRATICSLDGRRLVQATLAPGSAAQLSLQGLAAGLYVLRLDIHGRTYQQKLMVE